jgi:hypothetical protein
MLPINNILAYIDYNTRIYLTPAFQSVAEELHIKPKTTDKFQNKSVY